MGSVLIIFDWGSDDGGGGISTTNTQGVARGLGYVAPSGLCAMRGVGAFAPRSGAVFVAVGASPRLGLWRS
jgi:hypothetical protein